MAKIFKTRQTDLVALIIFLWAFHSGSTHAFGQTVVGGNQEIKESGKGEPLIKVLNELEEEYKVSFAYQKKFLINKYVNYKGDHRKDIEQYLRELLAPLGLSVRKIESVLIIQPQEETVPGKAMIADENGSDMDVSERDSVNSASVSPISIAGRVTSANEYFPLPGVNIQVSGTTSGTITDVEGNYTLKVPQNATLIFSYVGYESQTVRVNGRSVVNIQLDEDIKALAEIVVTALGIEKYETSLTYAQQNVGGEELTKVKDPNLINSLAGKAAGVVITKGSGGPGSSSKVLLRGNKSIMGNNSPLYVINGIPMNNAGGSQSTSLNYTRDNGDAISNLNPEDIASISILKGASAAALYGSDAANGVILITTKKGRAGVSAVNFSSSATFDEPMVLPELQTSYGRGTQGVLNPSVNDSWGPKIDHGSDEHLEEFFETGKTFINSLSITSGNELGQIYTSYANTNASGIVPEHEYNRHNFTLRGTTQVLEGKVSLDASVNYINQHNANNPSSGWYNSPLFGLYLFPVGDDFNKYKDYQYLDPIRYVQVQNWPYIKNEHSSNQNPYWIQNKMQSDNTRKRGIYSFFAKWNITDGLNLTGRATYDQIQDEYERRESAGSDPVSVGPNGGYEKALTNTAQLYADLLLSGTRNVGGSISISTTFGFSNTYNEYYNLSLGNSGSSNTLSFPNFFSVYGLMDDFISTESLQKRFSQALFGTATLGYKETVFLDITGRNDWSSTVSDAFFYPSIGLSYVLTETLGASSLFSFAKLRASYAEVGNALAFGVASWNPPYSLSPNDNINGRSNLPFFNGVDTLNLKPERSRSYELGLDLRLFQNKLGLNLTYYNATTDDQLLLIGAPSGSGANNFYVNGGTIRNKGVEAVLTYDTQFSDLQWSSSVNFSHNKNQIIGLTDLLPTDRFVLNSSFRLTQLFLLRPDSELLGDREYGSYGDIFGRAYVRDESGNIVYYDHDEKLETPELPQLSNANDQYLGNFNPDFLLGWNNQFNYKNFSFSFLIDGRFGGDIVSSTEQWLDFKGLSKRTGEARENGGVMVNGEMVDAEVYYKYISGNADAAAAAEEYIFDATNVRLRELALGYTLPEFSNAIKSLSISLVGRNLFFFYKDAPFDPEVSITTANAMQGIEGFNLPTTRSYGVTLSAKF